MHSTFRKEKHGWAELFQTWAPTLQEVCFHHSISEWWSHYRHGEACFLNLCFVEEIYTPPKTNTSPEKWWLEDECPLKMVPFLRDVHSLSGVYTTNVRTWVSIVILDVAPGDLVFFCKKIAPQQKTIRLKKHVRGFFAQKTPHDKLAQVESWFQLVQWNFKCFLFSPRSLGKWSNLKSIFFKWVGSTTN